MWHKVISGAHLFTLCFLFYVFLLLSTFFHYAFVELRKIKMSTPVIPSKIMSIFKKIDTNDDGFIDEQEIIVWLQRINHKTLRDDVEGIWRHHSLDPKDNFTWELHENDLFGQDGEYADEDPEAKEKIVMKEKRRWKIADKNGDNALDVEEALAFFHPETNPSMRDYIIDDVIEEIDKNGDGKIDEDEFIDDLWSHKPGEEEPEWVKSERKQFQTEHDRLTSDGKLDREEVADWILPKEEVRFKEEAKRLLQESVDGKLSLIDVLRNAHLFAGSEVTSFGELLNDGHDEL